MSEHDSDREIARLFEAQREADEALAPSFRETVHRLPRAARSIRSLRLIAAAAGTLVVATLALLLLSRPLRPAAEATESDASALAAWKAPTDVLLQTPGSELLNRTPILTSPVPESTEILPTQSKGGRG